MKWFLYLVAVVSLMLILPACGGPEKPAEPTPDIQAKLQADTDMENWFTEVQYAYGICSKALDLIDQRLAEIDAGGSRDNLEKLVEYFNMPGKVYDRLASKLKVVKQKSEQLKNITGIDQVTFKNLNDLNSIYEQLIEFIKTAPDNPADFRDKVTALRDRFQSIVKLLEKKFPQSAVALVQRRSNENPEYRRDERLLNSIPTPAPTVKAEPTAVPTETPVPVEEKPVMVWRDENGMLHMGQKPPEGVEVREPKGAVTKPVASGVETAPETTGTTAGTEEGETSGSSLIWTDENGVVHMGSKAPEGVKTKRADEIKLLEVKNVPAPQAEPPEAAAETP